MTSIESNASRLSPKRSLRNSILYNASATSPYYDTTKWKHECKYCARKFIYESHLRTHLNSAHRDDSVRYFCNRCDKCFNSQLLLNRHNLSYHAPKRYNCNNKAIRRKTNKRKLSDSSNNDKHNNDITKETDIIVKKRIKRNNVHDNLPIKFRIMRREKKCTKSKENLEKCEIENLNAQCKDYASAIVKAFYLSKFNGCSNNGKTYTCTICGKTSILAQNLMKHINMHDAKRTTKEFPLTLQLDGSNITNRSNGDIFRSEDIELMQYNNGIHFNDKDTNIIKDFRERYDS